MPEHAALVTAIILERPTCISCLSQKTGMSADNVGRTLERIEAALRVHRVAGRCHMCGAVLDVVSIARPLS